MNPLPRKSQSGVTLVELLVVMTIMTIVSGMIISVWFGLNNASAFTASSLEQQDFARDAISRMAAEIRDAQVPSNTTDTAFKGSSANEIDFYTTYNTSAAADPTTTPTLWRFILWTNGSIYREPAQSDGTFPLDPSADPKASLLVSNVVNSAHGRDLFTYSAYNADPTSHDFGKLYYSSGTTKTIAPSDIVTVQITALVDLNPGHSPEYVTVQTTVQPRNVLPR